jgi:hypothetical protein
MGERVSVYGPAVGLNVVTNFPFGQQTDHQLFSAQTVRAVVRALCLPCIQDVPGGKDLTSGVFLRSNYTDITQNT